MDAAVAAMRAHPGSAMVQWRVRLFHISYFIGEGSGDSIDLDLTRHQHVLNYRQLSGRQGAY